MKHTKISKLVSVVLAVCIMLLGAVSVSAESDVEAKSYVKAEQVVEEIEGKTVAYIAVEGYTVDANLAGITLVLLDPEVKDWTAEKIEEKIKDEEGEWNKKVVASVAQVFANKGGAYNYAFYLEEDATAGEYRLIATSKKNDVAETTVYFASLGTKMGVVTGIVGEGSTSATIVEAISSDGEKLGIDTVLWNSLSDEAKLAAAGAIKEKNEELVSIGEKEAVEGKDVLTAIEQINAETLNAAVNAGVVKDIATHEDKVENKAAIAEYKKLTEETKDYVMELLSEEGFEKAADMETALETAIDVAYMVVDGTADLAKFAEKASELKLENASRFAGLTDTQKRAVAEAVAKISAEVAAASAKEVAEGDAATWVSVLNETFKKEVSKYAEVEDEPVKEPTYISGSGGGGGGGGGGSSSNKNDKNDKDDKEEITTTPEPEVTTPEPEVVTPKVTYVDLDGYDWAKDAIYSLSEKKILAGYGDGIFNPANQIKREEFAKVIVTAIYGEEAINADKVPSFADAKSGWYTPYVGYAESTGLIKGVSETEFGVGNNITRQDIMTILYRVMLAKGYSANTTAIAYGDTASIADYAKDAVYALANAGVVGGYEDGTVRPTNQATRAEVAIMVDKFMKLF